MKYKKNDRREKALARHVERVIRAERVSAVRQVQEHAGRVLQALKQVDGAVEAIASELLRRKPRGRPRKEDAADLA